MIVSLNDPERVAGHLLASDVPGIAVASPGATDADAFALAKRIKTQPHMLAQHPPAGLADRARTMREVARQKLPERPFPDKTDPGGIFLGGIGQSDTARDRTNNRFRQMSHWKNRAGELRLIETVEEVTLVLGLIQSTQQFPGARARRLTNPRIVTGGNPIGAKHQCMVEK